MVRLAPALKDYGPPTGRSTSRGSILPSDLSNHASEVKTLPVSQNSNVIVAADQKSNAEGGGGFSTLATGTMFKRIVTDQRDNSPEVTPNCWACGGNINATDRFCSKCGAPRKLYSQGTSQTSSSELPTDTVFCPKCGGTVINALQVGSIATSTSITAAKLGNRLGPNVGKVIGMAHERAPMATIDEQCDAKVTVAREATVTDIKKLVAAAERHIADVQAAATGNPEKA
jgi:ribosomal protein S27AE